MRSTAFALTIIALPAYSGVNVCDYSSPDLASFRPENSKITLEYKHVRKEPGFKLEVGDSTFVLTRMPFLDLESGERYAITIPTEIHESPQGTMIHPSIEVSENRYGGSRCSDVAVDGQSDEVRVRAAQQHVSIVVSHVNKRRLLRTNRMYMSTLSFRTESTVIMVHLLTRSSQIVGCGNFKQDLASGKITGDWDCPSSLKSNDYDLVDNIDWTGLTESNDELLKGLDRLIDFVHVERID